MPTVSIVMRSKNDIDTIGGTLEGLAAQRYRDFELINIDSGSTDGTLGLIQRYTDRLEQIAPEDYNPGRVLNRGAELAQGEIVVFLNSDCTPVDEHWLERLIEPLDDPGVGAVYGRQLARPDAYPWFERDYLQAFPPEGAERRDGALGNASWRSFFSMASSACRKSTCLHFPFAERIQYSEDIEWAERLRSSGLRVEYVAGSRVFHSHNYTVKQYLKRCYEEGRADAQIFGDEAKSGLAGALLPLLSATARDTAFCLQQRRPLYALRAVPYRVVMKLGRAAGIRRGLSAPAELPEVK